MRTFKLNNVILRCKAIRSVMRLRLLVLLGLSGVLLVSFKPEAQDYTRYHEHTAQARACLLNEQFEKALNHYDSAFEGYTFRFSADCLTALQTAALLGKADRMYPYLRCTALAGVSLACINILPALEPYRNTATWQKHIADYAAWHHTYLQGIDTALNREFSERFDHEQSAKQKEDLTEYVQVVMDNTNRILALAKAGKYPGERHIGIANSYIIIRRWGMPGEVCDAGETLERASLLHHPYAYALLQPYLVSLMKNGDLHPNQVCEMYFFNTQFGQRSYAPIVKQYKNPPPDTKVTDDMVFNAAGKYAVRPYEMVARNREHWFQIPLYTTLSPVQLQSKYHININYPFGLDVYTRPTVKK